MSSVNNFGLPTEIKTDRLTLRFITDDDLDALHAIMSDKENMRYWSSLPHSDKAQTKAWIEGNRAAMAEGSAIEYGAEYRGKFIGRGTFWNGNEIGYIFDRAYWGAGLASECMQAMIELAFTTTDWVDIQADIDPRNISSLRLLERLGFHRVGLKQRAYCIGGEWSDSLYLALQREDWLAMREGKASQS